MSVLIRVAIIEVWSKRLLSNLIINLIKIKNPEENQSLSIIY